MRLSVIIVTWNGLRYLPACLEALAPQLPPDAEIVLVDNGSQDGTVAWLQSAQRLYPMLRTVLLPENLGFAGGNNVGIRAAYGDLLLLINNDVFVEPGCVQALLAAAKADQQTGAFGLVLSFAHRPELVASAGIVARSDGVALDLYAGQHVDSLPVTAQPIMGASGGGVLLRRAMLEDIGLFEPWFFNYLEDVDLAWRALLRGWETVLVPQARARHVYSATAGQGSPFKQRLLGRNRIAALIRCWPAALLARSLPRLLLYDTLAVGYGIARNAPAIAEGRADALRVLPILLQQRRAIQAARSAPIAAIARWIEDAPWPWEALQQQQRIDAIVRERRNE